MKTQTKTALPAEHDKEALQTRLKELDNGHRKKVKDYEAFYSIYDECDRPPAPEKTKEHLELEAQLRQNYLDEKFNDPDRFKLPDGWIHFNQKKRKDRIAHFPNLTNGRQPSCPPVTHFIYLYEWDNVAMECTFKGDYIEDLVALNYHHARMEHDIKLDDGLISRWIPIKFFENEFSNDGAYYRSIKKIIEMPDLYNKIFRGLSTKSRVNEASPLDALIRQQPAQKPEDNEFLNLQGEPFFNWHLYKRKFGFGGVVVSE